MISFLLLVVILLSAALSVQRLCKRNSGVETETPPLTVEIVPVLTNGELLSTYVADFQRDSTAGWPQGSCMTALSDACTS